MWTTSICPASRKPLTLGRMATKPPASVSAYLSKIGSKGGAAGTGAAKRRSTAFYSKIGKRAAESRAAARKSRKTGKSAK